MSESDHAARPTMGASRWPRIPFTLTVALWALALVGAIWAPYGFSMGGLLEEWDMRFLLNTGGIGWTAFPGQPMSDLFAARPLTPVTFALANFLAPDSFSGFHVLLLIACLMKVTAGSWLGWWVFRDRTIALAIGALTLVVPADTQQIALRNLHISVAVALLLIASVLTLQALYRPNLRQRVVCMVTAVVSGLIGCGIYEPVFPLYVLPVLLLYARLGLVRAWHLVRRQYSVVIIWLVGAVASGSYLVYAIAIRKTSYQVELAGGKGGSLVKSVIDNFPALIDSAAYRILIDGWSGAWDIATSQAAHWFYFPGMFLLFAVLLIVAGRPRRHRHYSAALVARTVAVGVLAVIAGYAPILVSVSHVVITQRTFLGAAPGAAILGGSLLALAALKLPRMATMLAAFAISLGLIAQLYQHDVYVRAYNDIMEPYMDAVARRSDASKSVHLVMDESGLGGYLGGVYVSKLLYGVTYMRSAYGDSYTLCKSERLQASMPFSQCALQDGSWKLSSVAGAAKSVPAAAVDVIEMPPFVVDDAFKVKPASSSLFLPSRNPTESYDCAADSMWGYSRFCAGEGWSDGVAYRAGHRVLSKFDALEPDPTLFFRLLPVDKPYVLQLLLAQPVANPIANTWTLEVNQSKVSMRAINATMYQGEVAAAALNRGPNYIRFLNVLPEGSAAPALSIRRISLAPFGNGLAGVSDMHARLRANLSYGIDDEVLRSALISGFSGPEPGGIWTDGGRAEIVFAVEGRKLPAALEISAIPFLSDKHPSSVVDAWVNKVRVATFDFKLGTPAAKMRIPLPENSLAQGTPIELRLIIRNPASPAEIGAGDRFLGLFIQEVKVSS